MELYKYQKDTVDALLNGKHIVVSGMGSGKTAMLMTWLKKKCEEVHKDKVLIITTPSKRDSCFPAGELINTPNGFVPIEKIKIGDEVYSYDGENIVIKKVSNKLKKDTDDRLLKISFGGCCDIIATEDHPFYVGDGKYRKLKDIHKGDYIYGIGSEKKRSNEKAPNSNGQILQSLKDWNRDRRIQSTSSKNYDRARQGEGLRTKETRVEDIQVQRDGHGRTHTVYCLEVEGTHNFFVNGILVHNCDMLVEADMWNGEKWRASLSSFEVISWHGLAKWKKTHSLSEIKNYVYGYDECLPADTKVKTTNGEQEIAELSVGDKVLSFNHGKNRTEYKKITRLIKKPSPSKMILLHLSNGATIISTGNHPHWTQNGYVEANDIKEGDILYEVHNVWEENRENGTDGETEAQSKKEWSGLLLHRVWSRIYENYNKKSVVEKDDREYRGSSLLQRMWETNDDRKNEQIQNTEVQENWKNLLLRGARREKCVGRAKSERDRGLQEKCELECKVQSVWEGDTDRRNNKKSKGSCGKRHRNMLFGRMQKKDLFVNSKKFMERRGICEHEEAADERDDGYEQSISKTRSERKSTCYERKKWVQASMGRTSRIKRWKRQTHGTADYAMQKAKPVFERVGDGTTSKFGEKARWVSNMLQDRRRERILQNRHRMRWEFTQFGLCKKERQEEGRQIEGIRVDGVEVLELGDIKRLGLYREPDYVYCIDVEYNHNFFANGVLTHNCAKASAGCSSGMGKAFLGITQLTPDWAGFTGTPGDTWIKFYPYFQATGLVRNKTSFRSKYVKEQTFKGYPEIIGYLNEDELERMWANISTAPDTSEMEKQLPPETYQTIRFKAPVGYSKTLKTRKKADGEFIDTNMALCHYLRQICFSNEKKQWISDFLENLGTNCVFFCNYIEEENALCEIAEKVLPKGAKIWRIDGKHHDIPKADTIGEHDIVVAHYASGGEALNLQFMNYWVAVSYNYSYSVFKQAMGRIRRIGQTKPMFFYALQCENTIEDSIHASLKAKQVFSEKVWCLENGFADDGSL